jgi:cupin 2 domain-containing protein
MDGATEKIHANCQTMTNIFSNIPTELPDELIETMLTAANLRIERIVSHGHATPEGYWYDQQQHEWVILLKGEALLQFENDKAAVAIKPGDYISIPAHRKHRVEWTTPDEPTIWLAIHYA